MREDKKRILGEEVTLCFKRRIISVSDDPSSAVNAGVSFAHAYDLVKDRKFFTLYRFEKLPVRVNHNDLMDVARYEPRIKIRTMKEREFIVEGGSHLGTVLDQFETDPFHNNGWKLLVKRTWV